MATKLKPQRLHETADTGSEQLAKRARTMRTETSIKDAFSTYADYLNDLNEKRERVVQVSRDITMNSKKVIFQIHRLSKRNKCNVLDKAGKDLEKIRQQHFSRLAKELQGTDFWKLRRAYSPGVQEYVEAVTFFTFCVMGILESLDRINLEILPFSDPSMEPLQINILDYILGLADLTGELMRLAIGRISDGEIQFAEKICQFVRQIHRELTLVVPHMDDSHDMKSKMEVMLQSVMKIENACFSVHVRGSEAVQLLGDDAPTSSPLGDADSDDDFSTFNSVTTSTTSNSSSFSVPGYLRDENLTQETKDLISSLPREEGWLVGQMVKFQGRWHTPDLLQGILNCQKQFKAQGSDIILVTNPRSGTTWLKALVFALLNRHKFPVSSGNQHPLHVTNPHVLVPFLEGDYYENKDFEFPDSSLPRLMSTHVSYVSLPESAKTSSCKIVYCCRNPKDMFVSLWHFGKEVAPEETADYSIEKAVEAFCKGKFIGGPFWDHVLEYWYLSRESPEKVLFVTYEELKTQTEFELKRIAEFLGCCFNEEDEEKRTLEEIVKLCSFESLSNLEVNKEGKLPNGTENKAFFRKGEIGGWKDTLTESLAEEIDRAFEDKFQGSGLKFTC